MTRSIIRSTIQYGCSIFLTSICVYGFGAYSTAIKDYLEKKALEITALITPFPMLMLGIFGAPLAFVILICS